MKVVYFIDHLRPDGTQRVLTQLVGGMRERGHEQAVVCLNSSWDGEVVDKLYHFGCDVRIVGKAQLASGIGLFTTHRWLTRERFDVAVTMLFAADVIGRLLAQSAGVPRIVTSLRARNINYTAWQRWVVRSTMPLADAVILNSQGLREFAIREEGASPDRLVVIPNGVQVSETPRSYTRDYLDSEFGLSERGYIIGSAGRLTYQKGIDVLLDAAARIPECRVQLLLLGEGEEMPTLLKRAGANGLNGRVHFPGYRHDLPRLLGTIDLFVQPSRFEGMPNTLLEAMAAGCPVIATAVDGNLDLVVDGESGWLSPPEDSHALAKCISAAISDPEEARRRGEAAKQRVGSSFSLDQMIGRWEKVLHEN